MFQWNIRSRSPFVRRGVQTIECVTCAHGTDTVQITELTGGKTGEQFEIIDTGPE
ncbi:hypothetical protein GCM10009579_14210 [Streptomyces javensis]|uniref:Uncharacterized protein n=1 Tax=Streptomyces javensis TaxID=114698 RepID=A0ABP4HB31_9ACTN